MRLSLFCIFANFWTFQKIYYVFRLVLWDSINNIEKINDIYTNERVE